MLWATAGFALFVMVGVSSVRAARRRLSYETWYGLHLYAYLAIALAFLHQLFTGADFIHDQLAAIYWISLYVVTAALVLTSASGCPWRPRCAIACASPAWWTRLRASCRCTSRAATSTASPSGRASTSCPAS